MKNVSRLISFHVSTSPSDLFFDADRILYTTERRFADDLLKCEIRMMDNNMERAAKNNNLENEKIFNDPKERK